MTPSRSRTVLLTGATGFLGKVALHELVRRQEELEVEGIVVVVRGRGSRTAAERFRRDVVGSPCLLGLPPDWTDRVRVLDGDLAHSTFGNTAEHLALLEGVTHVIHAAAAVSFTLPAPVAAKANVTTSLNLLAATRACPRLERIVYVSTAYVTPHRDGPIGEALVPLPRPAGALLERIVSGRHTDAELLAETGHPNTYTYTKTIAEHMVVEGRGDIPLSIVRPSIITASRQQPMPGWIDSATGFGAFVTLIGLGHMRALIGKADARLDLIPVDDVAGCMLDEMVATAPGVTIRHSVATSRNAPSVHECWEEIDRHFNENPVSRRPARRYLGPKGAAFAVADVVHNRVPLALANMGSPVQRRQASKLASRLDYLNDVFPYFTSRTFDFVTSVPAPAVPPRALVATVCRGVSRHMFRQRDDEWTLAGRSHVAPTSDLRWVLGQPERSGFVRFGIWLVTKTLRRITDAVTVDIPSFERARDLAPPGASIALTPSHRSFLDFIVVSYLAFARPDLGIRVPYIAAAVEFGRLPVLGRLLRTVRTFYVERGAVKENRHLAARVHTLLAAGEAIEFFVEGARSRTRQFLAPKRGLLRCVESSGRPSVLLPIAISYDRIPEESVFARELTGAPKAPLRLAPLFGWLADVWRGRVRLGRVHLACGSPILMDGTISSREAGDRIIDELRGAMAVTSFHLEAYAASIPADAPGAVDAATLRAAIEAAGGRVLQSALPVPPDLDPAIARTMLEHFAHYLAPAPVRTRTPDDMVPAEGWKPQPEGASRRSPGARASTQPVSDVA